MIQKVLGFTRRGEIRLTNEYVSGTIANEEIKRHVLAEDPSQKAVFLDDCIIVYDIFAGIYISFIVDEYENIFYILDLIHKFVLILDKYFGRVCEINLVYNYDLVLLLLNTFIAGGKCVETNEDDVVSFVRNIKDLKCIH
jgi:hypothetical protein